MVVCGLEPFVGIMAVYALVSAFAYPALVVTIVDLVERRAIASSSRLSDRGDRIIRDSAEILSDAMTTCQSVAISTFVYYFLEEMNDALLIILMSHGGENKVGSR